MKKIKSLALIILLIFLSSFHLFSQKKVDKILAIVNDEIITQYDYDKALRDLTNFLSKSLRGEEFKKALEKGKKSLLDNMIQEKLLISKAKELDISADQDIDLYIENIKKQNKISSDEELKKALSREGINYKEWREKIKKQIVQQKLIQKVLGDKIKVENLELTEYYSKHKEEFKKPAEYKIFAIYIDPTDISEDIDSYKGKIDKLLKEKKFSEVASEYSSEPLKSKKGNLGVFKENELAPEILSIVKKLKKGEISEWENYKDGWIKIKLVDKKKAIIPPFQDVQEKVYNLIYRKKRDKLLKQYVKELKKESYIKIFS